MRLARGLIALAIVGSWGCEESSTSDCVPGSGGNGGSGGSGGAGGGSIVNPAGLLSATVLEFGEQGTLFVADAYGAKVHAFETGDTATPATPPGIVYHTSVDLDLAAMLGAAAENVVINDLVVNPLSKNLYLAVHVGRSQTPGVAIIRYNVSDGQLELLDVGALTNSSASLSNAPAFEDTMQYGQSLRTLTITDMTYYNGELLVGGVSNQEFSSELRRISFPFDGSVAVATTEIFHSAHSRVETRAPIVTSLVHEFDGVPYLIAGYTCTPIVRFRLDDLVDGAHVVGDTIAELGFGNAPVDMIEYEASSMFGSGQRILVTNDQRGAVSVGIEAIRDAQPIVTGSFQPIGLDQAGLPLTGALHTAPFSDDHVVALRRNVQTGKLDLMSLQVGVFFEVSESVVEFNFPNENPSPFGQTNPIDYGFE